MKYLAQYTNEVSMVNQTRAKDIGECWKHLNKRGELGIDMVGSP